MTVVRKTRIKKPSQRQKDMTAAARTLLHSLRDKRAMAKAIGEEVQEVQTSLLAAMEAGKVDKVVTTYEEGDTGYEITGTKTHNTSVFVDEDKLKKAVGAPAFKKFCTLKLDKGLLEAAMSKDADLATVVASCSESKASAPFVRITEKKIA